MKTFDAIVLGVGGMGSAACWALARRGVKVLGIEQHTLGHALGSSHGDSRLIRQAYFEHPDYVPLLKSAYGLWEEIEAESGEKLFTKNGLVLFGPPDCMTVSGARESARLHGIPIELADPRDFPAFSASPGDVALYEPGAGWLAVEACVRTMAGLARKRGAEIREHARVESWREVGGGVEVKAAGETFTAKRLVVTAGAWSAEQLPGMRRKIDVRRVPVAWFNAKGQVPEDLPCFGFEGPAGFFYGFPPHGPRGIKVGFHTPGSPVADPALLDRALHPADAAPLEAFVRRHLPFADPLVAAHSVCMYAMSPDEHFIIDRSGAAVTYAAGFSGHGFKFASVIGDLLADLALDGATRHPAGFLKYRWRDS